MTTATLTRGARIDTARYLTLERQFCTRCYSEGKRVQVISAAELEGLRKGRTERAALAAYRKRRLRRLLRHYVDSHLEVLL